MKRYNVIIQRDTVKIKIAIYASGIQQAREIIKSSEGCPDRAILSVIEVKRGREVIVK